MNCPICQRSLLPVQDKLIPAPIGQTGFFTCHNADPDEHGCSAYIQDGKLTVFSLGFGDWYITGTESGWHITVYKEVLNIDDSGNDILASTDVITPEQGLQLLIKYKKLKAFI